MFCQTRVILFMGNVHDLTHSVFYVVHDCGCIPYPSRGRKQKVTRPARGLVCRMHPLPLTGTETAGIFAAYELALRMHPLPLTGTETS